MSYPAGTGPRQEAEAEDHRPEDTHLGVGGLMKEKGGRGLRMNPGGEVLNLVGRS